jgi:hypothetical protein
MAETPQQLLARAQAQLAKLQAQEAKLKAEAAAAKKQAAADRAAAITAERRATSPTAIEAVRTTAALKSYSEKVKSGLVPKAKGAGDTSTIVDTKTKVYTADDGKEFTDQRAFVEYQNSLRETGFEKQLVEDNKKADRQSAYDLLMQEFNQYGLGSLVEPLKGLIISGASPAEFTIKLRQSDAYKLRFAANAKRIANGFAAVDEATYLALEDRFQSLMQNYGLPESYYKKGPLGVQEKLEELIAKNVDAVTLEERIMEGVKINQGSKLLIDTAKEFYPSLTDGDFLAYALDPKNALSEIRRKVTASEIGSAQIGAGLAATVGGAEELAKAGITGKQYQQAAPTIAEAALRGGQLASFYKRDPYTQQTAEQAILDIPGSAEALRETKRLTALETAKFGGGSGTGAIARDRAGAI